MKSKTLFELFGGTEPSPGGSRRIEDVSGENRKRLADAFREFADEIESEEHGGLLDWSTVSLETRWGEVRTVQSGDDSIPSVTELHNLQVRLVADLEWR